MPKVSVIVTIYNAGKYLACCLDSLIYQTLEDIEIILVLDCPSDGSDVLAKSYATNDNRIVIVENKVNLHIGESRNEGLKIAQGEYVTFMDHDDFCKPFMLEVLYNKANSINADAVFSPLVEYIEITYTETTMGAYYEENTDLRDCILRQIQGIHSNTVAAAYLLTVPHTDIQKAVILIRHLKCRILFFLNNGL